MKICLLHLCHECAVHTESISHDFVLQEQIVSWINNFVYSTQHTYPTAISFTDRFGFGCLDESTVATIRSSLNTDVIPRHLQFLENIAASSKSGWIADTEGKHFLMSITLHVILGLIHEHMR